MEELKILIEMVANLPAMAIWVLIGFFVYKVVVIGSIFGLIRLFIIKAHNWLTAEKKVAYKIDDYFIDGEAKNQFILQFLRLKKSTLNRIHYGDVEALERAIDKIKSADY